MTFFPMNKARTWVCLMVGVASVTAAVAQEKRQILARTLCFSRAESKDDIFIATAEGVHKILLPINRHSHEFTCVLVNNRAVFFKQDGMDDEGKPKRIVVATAKVPTGVRKALFYFVPAEKDEKMLYNVRVMNDDLRAFPMGHSRALNLYGRDVGFQFGEHLKKIKPGGLAIIPPVKKKDDWNMAVVMCRMQTNEGTWRTISETKMRFTGRKRLLVVSYIDQTTRRPRLRFYRDVPLPPEPGQP